MADGNFHPSENPKMESPNDVTESQKESSHDDTQMYYSRQSHLLTKVLNKVRAKDCDITIRVGQEEFPCHREVLENTCPYFKRMLNCAMRESTQREIELKEILPTSFSHFMDFIYKQEFPCDINNVVDLLKLSDMWLCKILRDRCEEFLLQNVTEDNCFEIWKVADVYNCNRDFLKKIKEFCAENFTAVTEKEGFFETDIEIVTELIGHASLKVDKEENVFSWMEKHIKQMERNDPTKYLSEDRLLNLLKAIELRNCSDKYLLKLQRNEIMNKYKALLDYCSSALEYVLHQASPRYHTNFDTSMVPKFPRLHTKSGECSLFLGGSLHSQHTPKYVYRCKLRSENDVCIDPLATLPVLNIQSSSCCAFNKDIYATFTAMNNTAYFYKFDTKVMSWSQLPSLCHPRSYHNMLPVEVENRCYIYILGGYSTENETCLKSIERYCIDDNTISLLPGSLHRGVFNFASCCYQDKIFIFGGYCNVKEYCPNKMLQIFDLEEGECIYCELSLPYEIGYCQGILFHHSFVIIANGKILLANMQELESMKDGNIASGNGIACLESSLNKVCFTAVLLGRQIICLGGRPRVNQPQGATNQIVSVSVDEVLKAAAQSEIVHWKRLGTMESACVHTSVSVMCNKEIKPFFLSIVDDIEAVE